MSDGDHDHEPAAESAEADALADVADGAGCAEIWETLSKHRDRSE